VDQTKNLQHQWEIKLIKDTQMITCKHPRLFFKSKLI
jgi:hypothetical protein